MMPQKALILGIDGADPSLIDRWAREERLPHLRSLMSRGAHGTLLSTLPCCSPAAWGSFMTGVNPAKHGVFGYFRIHPGTGRRVPCVPGDLRAPPFWTWLGEAGLRTGVIDLPFADPAAGTDGFLLGVQLRGALRLESRPPSLALELSREFPDLIVDVYWQGVAERMSLPEDFLRDLDRMTEQRAAMVARAMDLEPSDVLTVVLGGIDRLQHAFWRWMEPDGFRSTADEIRRFGPAIRAYYERVDTLLGTWLDRCGPDTHVLVLSDHGFGPLRAEVRLNNWLRDRGDLVLAPDAPRPPRNSAPFLRKQVGRWLPEWAKTRLRPMLASPPAADPPLAVLDRPEWIDWSRTRALAIGGGMNGIYLNLPPLFTGGAFRDPAEAAEYRRSLTEDLRHLIAPGGEGRIFDRVIQAEDSLVGPFLDQSPHLFLESETVEVVDGLSQDPWYDPAPAASGHHRPEGFFCVSGPRIRAGRLAKPLRMVDVAPVLLTALGLPVPAHMDGDPPAGLFSDGVAVRRSPAADLSAASGEGVLSDERISRIRTELKRLGYLRA